MEMVVQPYPLFLAAVRDGVVEAGRIIGWSCEPEETHARPVYIRADSDGAVLSITTSEWSAVLFIGDTLQQVEAAARRWLDSKTADVPDDDVRAEHYATNVDNTYDDDLPIHYDELLRQQEVLNEKAAEPPVTRKPKAGNEEDDPANETRTVDPKVGRDFQGLIGGDDAED